MPTRREFLAGSAAMLALTQPGLALAADTTALPTLGAIGAARGLLVGCAVAARPLREDAAYRALIRQQARIVVAENAFKFGALRPSPTAYYFDDADALASFATENNMVLRGHNFVWHRQIPRWFAGYVTPANAEQVLVDHIEKVGGRYAGRIQSWDVVNEAVHPPDHLPHGLRNSPWQQVLGNDLQTGKPGAVPAYIEIAFRTARRVDPKALLTYNDYGIEGDDDAAAGKRRDVLALLRAMKERDIPLDALGVQSHVDARASFAAGPFSKGLGELIAGARKLGLKVMLTEMDVNDKHLPPPIPQRDAAVAATYATYLQTALADPAVIAVLTWGITDRYTWLNGEDSRADKLPERPLPFDASLQPKLAVPAMLAALRGAPTR